MSSPEVAAVPAARWGAAWWARARGCRVRGCCLLLPLRPGLLALAYLNVVVALVLIVGICTETVETLLSRVQMAMFEDYSKSVCVLSPAADLAFSVVLVCGLHRRDVVMLRWYVWYCGAAMVTSLLVYSVIAAALTGLFTVALLVSLLYQGYMIVLVRSMIVELQLGARRTVGRDVEAAAALWRERRATRAEDTSAATHSGGGVETSAIGSTIDRPVASTPASTAVTASVVSASSPPVSATVQFLTTATPSVPVLSPPVVTSSITTSLTALPSTSTPVPTPVHSPSPPPANVTPTTIHSSIRPSFSVTVTQPQSAPSESESEQPQQRPQGSASPSEAPATASGEVGEQTEGEAAPPPPKAQKKRRRLLWK